MGKGEAYTSEGTQADRAVGSTVLLGSCPILPGSRCVGESYSKILSTKTHLRPAMQRQRLSRQARIGAMQIFSELRQPFSRSASRQTQQVEARPATPGTLLSSLWGPGMFSSAGSPPRDASGLSWAEGLGKVSVPTSDMFKHQLWHSSPPKGLNSITVHYCETQTERDGVTVTALSKNHRAGVSERSELSNIIRTGRRGTHGKKETPRPLPEHSAAHAALPKPRAALQSLRSCFLATFIIPYTPLKQFQLFWLREGASPRKQAKQNKTGGRRAGRKTTTSSEQIDRIKWTNSPERKARLSPWASEAGICLGEENNCHAVEGAKAKSVTTAAAAEVTVAAASCRVTAAAERGWIITEQQVLAVWASLQTISLHRGLKGRAMPRRW